MIQNQKNKFFGTNFGATERLLNLLCEIKTFNSKVSFPMLSMPENDEYWSEGWQPSIHNHDSYATSSKSELLLSMPTVSSPVSSNSSSPSPSQSDQSNSSSVKTQPFCDLDFDCVNDQEYQSFFCEKVS
jgi:hypothetical protein